MEDLKGEKIISFSRQNLSDTERYFTKKFEEHDLSKSFAYTGDDTFSLVSLVSAGLGIDLPNRKIEPMEVRDVDFPGLPAAWLPGSRLMGWLS
ncbi:hypothetical protein KW852_33105 [Ensifer sp. ENS12]|nr:hypothetical protein [Ensifer sp. ENS12]